MSHPLNRNLLLVKEHVGMFKAANNYDIHDPDTNEIIIHCREDRLGLITKLLRFTSDDNSVLGISEDVPPDSTISKLILAAVMCIDMVLKE